MPDSTPQQPQADRLLSWPKVRELCGGLGRTTVYTLRMAGDFPPPVTLSPGRVAWREADIRAWLASRTERAA